MLFGSIQELVDCQIKLDQFVDANDQVQYANVEPQRQSVQNGDE